MPQNVTLRLGVEVYPSCVVGIYGVTLEVNNRSRNG